MRNIIAYPPHTSVVIRDVLIQLCKGNACAAALLDYFESLGIGAHRLTLKQLEAGVIIYRRDTIRAALALLELHGLLTVTCSSSALTHSRTFEVNFAALNARLNRKARA